MARVRKNCKNVSVHWCMRRKKGVKKNKDWCTDFQLSVNVRY